MSTTRIKIAQGVDEFDQVIWVIDGIEVAFVTYLRDDLNSKANWAAASRELRRIYLDWVEADEPGGVTWMAAMPYVMNRE